MDVFPSQSISDKSFLFFVDTNNTIIMYNNYTNSFMSMEILAQEDKYG